MLAACEELGIGFEAFSPLANMTMVDLLKRIAERKGDRRPSGSGVVAWCCGLAVLSADHGLR